jgi:hypothetical protein
MKIKGCKFHCRYGLEEFSHISKINLAVLAQKMLSLISLTFTPNYSLLLR